MGRASSLSPSFLLRNLCTTCEAAPEGPLVLAMAPKTQYFGGNMKIAEGAKDRLIFIAPPMGVIRGQRRLGPPILAGIGTH